MAHYAKSKKSGKKKAKSSKDGGMHAVLASHIRSNKFGKNRKSK